MRTLRALLLFAFLIVPFELAAQSPVTFELLSLTGATNNRQITVTAHDHGQFFGSNFMVETPLTFNPTNGTAVKPLLPDTYDVNIDGIDYTFIMQVPGDGQPYNAFDLIQNYVASTEAIPPLAAGNNITLTTNLISGVAQITIASSGGGGGGGGGTNDVSRYVVNLLATNIFTTNLAVTNITGGGISGPMFIGNGSGGIHISSALTTVSGPLTATSFLSSPVFRLLTSPTNLNVLVEDASGNLYDTNGLVLSGPITASAFSGDGSALTGLQASAIAGVLPVANGGTAASTVSGATNTLGLGAMALQPTNNPNFYGGTNHGTFTIIESGTSGVVSNNDAILNIQSMNGLTAFQVWYNWTHTVEPETQIAMAASLSFTLGLDGLGKAICHFGGSGQYNSLWYMQYNDSGDLAEPGQSTPFGFAWHATNGDGATQTFHFSGFHMRQNPAGGQGGELQWHDKFGKPTTTGGSGDGFQQTEWDATDHIAVRLSSNGVAAGGFVYTNSIQAGNIFSSPVTSNYSVDCSVTGYDHQVVSPLTPALNLVLTNLAYTNVTLKRAVTIHAGFIPNLALSLPASWINMSSLGTNTLFPTNIPGSNDVTIFLRINCEQATNVYVDDIKWGWNPPTLDADASAFIAAAGITGGTNLLAVNNFVIGLKQNNLWARWDAIYPLMGTTSTMQKYNLINPALYNMTWTAGSSTWDVLGWHSDGSTSYGDTGFVPSSAGGHYTEHSATMLIVNRTGTIGGSSRRDLMGTTDTFRASIATQNGTTLAMDGMNDGNGIGNIQSFAIGAVLAITRESSVSSRQYSGNVAPNFDATASTGLPTKSILIGARHSGGVANNTAFNPSLVMIGGSISQTEYTALLGLINTFEATLGR